MGTSASFLYLSYVPLCFCSTYAPSRARRGTALIMNTAYHCYYDTIMLLSAGLLSIADEQPFLGRLMISREPDYDYPPAQ